jgi:hypothetical protein
MIIIRIQHGCKLLHKQLTALTTGYLEVCGGVPVDVIEHNPAGADQVQTSSARLPNQTTLNDKGSGIRNIL